VADVHYCLLNAAAACIRQPLALHTAVFWVGVFWLFVFLKGR
jgi:hypothetical protein